MLYGRDSERAAIASLMDNARAARSGALVLRGDPGIGKSALLEHAHAQAGDMHVLAARGVESEYELPFSGIDQLLRPALPLIEALPGPQAAALRGALGMGEDQTERRFLAFAACLSLLSELAEQKPVLCLVDDAHWLDAASAEALVFVARRLDAEGIALLFAARASDVVTFDAPGIPSLVVAGLDDGAAAQLLADHVAEIAPHVRDRILATARGNSLALVELPEALTAAQRAGADPLPDALPLTRQMQDAFLARINLLPDETRRLLLLAAADDSEDAGLVLGAGAAVKLRPNALDAAEAARLVSLEGRRLEFRHPLVRSAVYDAAPSSSRRDAHRALATAAGAVGDADRQAWHLAAAAVGPDEDVARSLEDVATRAANRAGHIAAAKALTRAAELSRHPAERARRLVLASRAASIGGVDEFAVAVARQAEPLTDDPVLLAEIARSVGAAAVRRGRPLEAVPELLDATRRVAPVDRRKAVELLTWANAAAFSVGSTAAVADISRVRADVASTDVGEMANMLDALDAWAHAIEGRPADAERLSRAFDWAETAEEPEFVFVVAVAAHFAGEEARSEALIDRTIMLGRSRGELGILAEALTTRAMRRTGAQRLDEAQREAEESLAFALDLKYENVAIRARSVLAHISGLRGDELTARTYADDVVVQASAHGLAPRIAVASYSYALIDLSRGRWEEALERLEIVVDHPRAGGDALVAMLALPDTIEAAARATQTERARRWLQAFENLTEESGIPWMRPRLLSCRALLAADDDGTALFEEAISLGDRARPFDLARIHLLYGEHLRRLRRRRDARRHLRIALDGFERFRAEAWADRVRAELRASGETARKRDPSTSDQLTPQELQIARFVAEGLANKEIAAQLYLSPRTIDYHLRNIFSKLGLTSRTQLARLPLGEDERASGAEAPRAYA